MLNSYSDWRLRGACNQPGVDPDIMFGGRAHMRYVRDRMCLGCEVVDRCLVEAMDGDVDFGVFGALTPPERRRLRKSMPDVVSWHNYIKSLKKPPLNLSGISVVAYLCTRADVNTFFRRSGSMSNKLSEDTEKAG